MSAMTGDMSASSDDFIPQANPKLSYLAHKDEIDSAVRNVLESGRYILGQEVEAFEKEFASCVGVHHSVGVGSGTDAIEIALRVLDIGPDALVFTVSHTAVATVAAIERAGAIPVLVDVDPESYTINVEHLNAALQLIDSGQMNIQGRPAAIIPVHLYGHPANMPEIMNIAHRYRLYIIEDCAQAHGASINGKMTGAFGDIAAFSFYPTKNLGALGDGGIVLTNNPELYKKLLALRQYGWEKNQVSSVPGINSRIDEIQAAILRVKLKYLRSENERRRDIASAYSIALSNTNIFAPVETENVTHVYHQYVIRTKQRDDLIEHLRKKSVGTAIHYPLPVHLQPAYRGRINIAKGGMMVTEKICQEIISLPVYPQLRDEQVKRIIDALLCHRQ
jgi:dTDP-4-amino-4,6-dideoxygalactose transaminase